MSGFELALAILIDELRELRTANRPLTAFPKKFRLKAALNLAFAGMKILNGNSCEAVGI
jgi:hypothetical protein